MNRAQVISQLQNKYPGSKIISLPKDNPTEILCEVDPTTNHADYSVAVSVIDKTDLHSHNKTTETYKILEGELDLFIDGVKHHLRKGDSLIIKPHTHHSAIGNETWIECRSEPGWTLEDHILTDVSKVTANTYGKIAGMYTKQYFSDLIDIPYIDEFLKLLSPKAKILDVGCGPGQFTKHMLEKGFDVTGVDYSEEMLNQARKMVPDGKFKFMDMRHLEFDDASFDGLLVSYSLIHIPSSEIPETLKGFKRVLKSGGYMEIIAQKGESDRLVDEPFMPDEKMFFNFFSKERLSGFLTDAGFKVVCQKEGTLQDAESASDTSIYTIARKT